MTTETPAPAQITNAEPVAAPVLPPTYHLDRIAPRQTGALDLSDGERQLLAEAARSGDLRGAWAKIHGDREAAATAANADLLAREAAEQAAQQPAQEGTITNEMLLERTGGAVSMPVLEAAITAGELTSSRLEHIAQTQGRQAFDAAVAQGHADVLQRNFRGDRGAWERAINEIDAAANVIDPSGGLVEALVTSGVLSDGALFRRIEGMACSILRKRS